jgi:hypothetical protein
MAILLLQMQHQTKTDGLTTARINSALFGGAHRLALLPLPTGVSLGLLAEILPFRL